MAHPFDKLLYKALKASSEEENLVLKKAEDIRKRGYSPKEIHSVLKKLHDSLVEDTDKEIVAEALEELEGYVGE